jgi:predicted transposase YdaD
MSRDQSRGRRLEGKEEGFALAIARMAANQMPIERIAAILELEEQHVRQVLLAAKQK